MLYTAFLHLCKPSFLTMLVNKAYKHKYVSSGSISSKVAGRAHHSLGCGRVPQIEGTWRVSTDLQLKLGSRNSGGRGSGSKSVV